MPLPVEVAVSKSLAINAPEMNVDPADVEEFMALARAGVIGGHEISGCGAVQDDIGIGRATRTTLAASR